MRQHPTRRLVPDERHAQFHNRDPKGACQPAARDRWRPFRSAERPPTDRLVSSSDIRPVSAFECQNFPRLVGCGDPEDRPEASRVGKEGVSTGSSRGWTVHKKIKIYIVRLHMTYIEIKYKI